MSDGRVESTAAESISASTHMDAFLDESCIEINGRKLIVFGTVIPHDLSTAVASLASIKRQYGLSPTTEVKWASRIPLPPEAKAAIKQDTLEALAAHFACLICITEGIDRTVAFTNALRQVHDFAVAMSVRSAGEPLEQSKMVERHVSIHYDEDAFRDPAPVLAELSSWSDVMCSGLARASSAFTAGIQYADILAGTFSYILRVRFGKSGKRVSVPDDFGEIDVCQLDDLMQVLLRWNVWGEVPPTKLTAEEEQRLAEGYIPWREEFYTAKCLGKGVRVHGAVSVEEMTILDEAATYYRGCMH